MEILISDRQDMKIDQELVKKLCRFVLEKEKASEDAEVSISFVTTDEMYQLNERYRKIDKPTDVLSFSLIDDYNADLLGDMVLCPVEIERKAQEQEISFDEYLKLLVVHSTLHLLGYSHKSDANAKVMSDREEELLKSFKI